ncbi:p450 domain containing protein [Asbolus verrucosus]|uniref:p450 domain containing protein n=1 Tax=Asbolus verrucosus TaxID=1661398 RepID=A0A482W9Z3_ASBVE|nr:p450 domain containing protein [Asbolus verrucosus]
MIFIYLGCILLLLYYLLTKDYNYWQYRGIPFDKPFLIFGNFYKVITGKEHISERIRAIYNQHKTPYVGIFIFNQPLLMVKCPELLKKILVKDFDKFVNRKLAANESVDPISFHTLFTAKDTTWRNLRAKISPVFTSGKMKLMLPLMKECAQDLTTHLTKHDGKIVEMRHLFKKFAVDVISSCAFGINAYCLKDDNSEILQMATQLIDFNSFFRNFSVFCFFFVPKLVDIFRLTFADKTATKYFMDVFNVTIKQREKKNIVRNDLIDLLNNLKNNETFGDNYKFDNIKMAAQAVVFFSAGNDTTAITLSFALYELALNKEVQNRLRQEVRETFDKERDFTYEALQEMKYLDMVLKETLRKYPLTTFLNRNSTSSYTFEETGVTLEKDVSILVPVGALHYDPEYFPDPEKFDPERFNDENKRNIKPYTYMPFGEGPRNCIGERFALLASKVAVAYVIKDFTFETTSATTIPLQIDPAALFLQSKGGVHLKVIRI